MRREARGGKAVFENGRRREPVGMSEHKSKLFSMWIGGLVFDVIFRNPGPPTLFDESASSRSHASSPGTSTQAQWALGYASFDVWGFVAWLLYPPGRQLSCTQDPPGSSRVRAGQDVETFAEEDE